MGVKCNFNGTSGMQSDRFGVSLFACSTSKGVELKRIWNIKLISSLEAGGKIINLQFQW